MRFDSLIVLFALFGAFAIGFGLGLAANWLRHRLAGLWRAPGKMAHGLARFGSRIRETLHPVAQEDEELPELVLPTQPISRAVALVLSVPIRRAQELFQMGEEELAAGNDRVAEGHYMTALIWDRGRSLLPLHIRANLRLGEIRDRRGDLPGAILAYERARDLDPANVQAYLQLGQLYFRADRAGQALYELGRALELDPTNLDVRYHLFQIYQQSGMHQEATRQLRMLKAGEDAESIAALFSRHGQDHLRQGQLELAATDLYLVLELLPGHGPAALALGDILRRQGEREEALRVWVRGLWVAPSPALDERLLALAREGIPAKSGDPQEAGRSLIEAVETAYRRALLLHPRTGRLHLVLGDLAEVRGSEQEAVSRWEQAAAEEPTMIEAHLRLEKYYESIGAGEQARGHLHTALHALWGQETVYRCRSCGQVTVVEQPYCFACGAWGALVPLTRAELEARSALVPVALVNEARSVARRLEGWWGRVWAALLGAGEEQD